MLRKGASRQGRSSTALRVRVCFKPRSSSPARLRASALKTTIPRQIASISCVIRYKSRIRFQQTPEEPFFNSEAGKELRLTSPLASRLEAALIGLGVGGVSHTEARRHGGFDEQSAARKGEICSADFMKCAGDGKPHFIKCGFGGGAFCGQIAMLEEVAC